MNTHVQNMIWNMSSICIGFALPLAILGPIPVYVLLLLGIIFGLIATHGASLRVTVNMLLKSPITALVVAILTSYSIACFYAINPAFAFGKLQDIYIVALAAIGLYMCLREMSGTHVRLLQKSMAVSVLLVIIIFLADLFMHNPWYSQLLHGDERALTPHRFNFLSSILAVLLPFSWAWYIHKYNQAEPIARRFAFPLIMFGFFSVIVFGGRAGWVGCAVALLLFLLIGNRHHNIVLHRMQWFWGGVTGLLAIGVYGLTRGWEQLGERLFIADQGSRGMGGGRLDVWHNAWYHFIENPWFGIGLQNYRFLPEDNDLHPHNFILQLLLETGLLGTLLTLLFVSFVIFHFYRFSRKNIYGVAALCSMAAFWSSSLANKSLFNVEWLVFFVVIALFGWRLGWATERKKMVVHKEKLPDPDYQSMGL